MAENPTTESSDESSSDESSSDESSEDSSSSEESSSDESSSDESSSEDSSQDASSEDSSSDDSSSEDSSSGEEPSSEDSSSDDSSSEESSSDESSSDESSSDESSSDESSSDESSSDESSSEDSSSDDSSSDDSSSDDSSEESSSEDSSASDDDSTAASSDEGSGDGLDDAGPGVALVARTNSDLDHANALVVNMWLNLRLRDDADQPRAGLPYKLTVAGQTTEGKTDDQGMILERMPLNETDGTLEFEDHQIALKLYQLPPIDQISGVQARLSNLNYYAGENDNQLSQATQDALRRFQNDMVRHGADLAVTGDLDDATRVMLLAQHGS